MKKIIITAITALLVGCNVKDELHESDLYGCWGISANIIASYISFDSNNTYQMMLSEPDKLYNNNGTPEARRQYYEGNWSLNGYTVNLLVNDSTAYVLQNVEKNKGSLSFDMKQGGKMWKYAGKSISELSQSEINGTWSFSEREVFWGIYDMVMTLDDTYHARMTFLGTEDGRSYKMYDWKDIDYTILGNYIVFTGLNPVYYFYRNQKDDGRIEYTSGNSSGTITRFSATKQDPTAHELRLDGFIF